MAEVSFLAKHFSVDQKTIRKCLEQTSRKTGQSKKRVLEIVSESLAPGLRLGDLPIEILFEISLKHLPVEDILRFCQTSREFKALCDSNFVWKKLLQRDYGVDFEGEDAKKEYQRLKDSKGLQKLAVGRYTITMINRKGKILVWGAMWPRERDATRFTEKVRLLRTPRRAEQVSSSQMATVVASSGNIYMWAHEFFPVQSLGKNVDNGVFKLDFQGTVKQVSMGSTEIGLLTQEGDVWKASMKSPEWTQIPIYKAEQISFSGTESAVVKEGDLYMWGRGEYGQLGLGLIGNVSPSSPQKVPFPAKIKIQSVSCGWRHIGAVTTEGDLYMWGYNGWGQIGDGTKTNRYEPKKILEDVVQVSCGGDHTGAIKKNGELYMWGGNPSKQLGFSFRHSQMTPRKKVLPEEVIEVSCGLTMTAVITASYEVYAWGLGTWDPDSNPTTDHKPHHIADL